MSRARTIKLSTVVISKRLLVYQLSLSGTPLKGRASYENRVDVSVTNTVAYS
jgi:hypothetical protein